MNPAKAARGRSPLPAEGKPASAPSRPGPVPHPSVPSAHVSQPGQSSPSQYSPVQAAGDTRQGRPARAKQAGVRLGRVKEGRVKEGREAKEGRTAGRAAVKSVKSVKSVRAVKAPAPSSRDAARVAAILQALDEAYPDAVCALDHRTPWELLVATILSAQCTDARVNMVTPELFRRFPTPRAMSGAGIAELEELIRTTGFYHNKARSILGAARRVTGEFGGEVPRTLAELITIPGAARKTANVVLGVSFGLAEGVVVDTHVFRIARRLDLARGETAQRVEQELIARLPRDHWIRFSHQVIHHGRRICTARSPRCRECSLEPLCRSGDKTWQS